MTSMPNFFVKAGGFASQNQFGQSVQGKIKSDTAGAVVANTGGAVGNLSLSQKLFGSAQAGGDQSLSLFTNSSRSVGAQTQAGNVNCGILGMNSLLSGTSVPGAASGISAQSAHLKGNGAFQSTSSLSAIAGDAPIDPYNGGNGGSYWGDPHLVGFDGEKYDVMGEAGKTYNMLSDKGLQYNTRFDKYGNGGATVIGAAGINVGKSKVNMDKSGAAPTVDGQAMTAGQSVALDQGGSATWDGSKLTVKTSEYTISLNAVKDPNGDYLNSDVKINDNPFGDGVKPHGLLGQTADGVAGAHVGQDGNVNDAKNGGTVIDGTVKDYEMAGLNDTASSKYNRFNAASAGNLGIAADAFAGKSAKAI